MTIAELPTLLTQLGFDADQLPARRGPITLAELEYDEIEASWHFRFRWDDITIPLPTKEIPNELWEIIKDDASPGETETMIFSLSPSSNWDADSPMLEILIALRSELGAFTAKVEGIKYQIGQYL